MSTLNALASFFLILCLIVMSASGGFQLALQILTGDTIQPTTEMLVYCVVSTLAHIGVIVIGVLAAVKGRRALLLVLPIIGTIASLVTLIKLVIDGEHTPTFQERIILISGLVVFVASNVFMSRILDADPKWKAWIRGKVSKLITSSKR